jgi:hypothetical protein
VVVVVEEEVDHKAEARVQHSRPVAVIRPAHLTTTLLLKTHLLPTRPGNVKPSQPVVEQAMTIQIFRFKKTIVTTSTQTIQALPLGQIPSVQTTTREN